MKDTGIGISQERIEMLFSGDDEVKDSSGDFALGLSISKKIVMTQQGQIGVISDKDDGSLFWVFFPSTRNVLHDAKVFNPKNASHPISFDHMLNARRFSAVIVREENIYGNRAIEDYVRGNSLFQLLEADKIKEKIRDREMDMWNY